MKRYKTSIENQFIAHLFRHTKISFALAFSWPFYRFFSSRRLTQSGSRTNLCNKFMSSSRKPRADKRRAFHSYRYPTRTRTRIHTRARGPVGLRFQLLISEDVRTKYVRHYTADSIFRSWNRFGARVRVRVSQPSSKEPVILKPLA